MRLVGAAGAERARDQALRDRHRRATPRRARAPARTAPAGAPAAATRRRRAGRGGRRRPPARPRPGAPRPRRGAAAARRRRRGAGRRDDRARPAPPPPRPGAPARARARPPRARGRAPPAPRRAQRAQRELGRGQLGHRRQRRRQAARIEARQRGRGLVEAAEQQQPARRDQPRLQRVGAIGVRLERGRGRRQRARRAAEVAHGQRHLGLGDDAACARQLLVGAEAAGGAPQQLAGARVLAELGHGDAAQGQRRRVVAQGDALEGAERVAGGEGARGGGDQGVHGDRLHPRADIASRLQLSERWRARP